jgi:RNA polymerase sigma-70 factor (ECF subfamily)
VSCAIPQVESSRALAERCQEGDARAYAELLERFGPRIYGFLHHLVGNAHDAEDLTQEVFVKAYRNIDKFDPSRAFDPWLFTIARRTAATFHRRKKPVSPLDDEPASDAPSPRGQVESDDDCRRIWAFARALKPRYFEVLWLRYREDFSLDQIAESIGTTHLNTKVLLHRARTELAGRLEAAGMLHPSP